MVYNTNKYLGLSKNGGLINTHGDAKADVIDTYNII